MARLMWFFTIFGTVIVGAWVTINCISISHRRTTPASYGAALKLYHVLVPMLPFNIFPSYPR